jgi:hypothetical protein
MRLVVEVDSTVPGSHCKVLRANPRVLRGTSSSLYVWAVVRLSLCLVGLFSAYSLHFAKVMSPSLTLALKTETATFRQPRTIAMLATTIQGGCAGISKVT